MNLGVGFLVMEMLSSSERSGLQVHLVFKAEVYFLTMVVGVVLPPGHAIFRCSLTSSVILLPSSGRQVCYQNKDDNQLVQVIHEDLFMRYIK